MRGLRNLRPGLRGGRPVDERQKSGAWRRLYDVRRLRPKLPQKAIRIEKTPEEDEKPDGGRDVWVFAEHDGSCILPVAFELLGKGRELADRRAAAFAPCSRKSRAPATRPRS
jgi:hypothetical protein